MEIVGKVQEYMREYLNFLVLNNCKKSNFLNSEIEAGKGGKFPSFPPKMPWPVFNFLFDLVSGGEAAGRERNPGRGGGEGQTPS